MRVTTNSFPRVLIDQLGNLAVRQHRLQSQASTGQRIQTPDDDPVAMRRVLDLQVEASAAEQFRRNIVRHQETATLTHSAMKSLKKVSDRAAELATLADGLRSQEELDIYAAELNELVKQAVDIANSRNRGDYLLAGTRNDQPPFVVTTDANGIVTAVTYQGNEQVPSSEVAEGALVASTVPGANTSGNGPRGLLQDPRNGADLFNHLIELGNHLRAGDTDAIRNTDRANLARDEDNFIFHFGQNSVLQARLEIATTAVADRAQSLEVRVSREADADLAQTIVRLTETQTAYRAALQSGGTILNMSLLDYIR